MILQKCVSASKIQACYCSINAVILMLDLSVQEGIDWVITNSNDGGSADLQMLQMFPAILQISQNHSSVSWPTGGIGLPKDLCPDSSEKAINLNRFISYMCLDTIFMSSNLMLNLPLRSCTVDGLCKSIHKD